MTEHERINVREQDLLNGIKCFEKYLLKNHLNEIKDIQFGEWIDGNSPQVFLYWTISKNGNKKTIHFDPSYDIAFRQFVIEDLEHIGASENRIDTATRRAQLIEYTLNQFKQLFVNVPANTSS